MLYVINVTKYQFFMLDICVVKIILPPKFKITTR